MLRTVCLGLLGLAAVSCNSTRRNPDADLKGVSETVYLGMGYDTDAFQPREECVMGVQEPLYQTQTDWKFKKIDNWEMAKREMGYSVEGEYSYGLAKVTSKSTFTRNMQDTDRTTSYLLVADFVGVTNIIKDGELKAKYKTMYDTDDKGKAAVRRRCGNAYVSRVDSGGMLRVIVKFHFNNKTVKNDFSFSGGVSAGVKSVSTTVKHNERERPQKFLS